MDSQLLHNLLFSLGVSGIYHINSLLRGKLATKGRRAAKAEDRLHIHDIDDSISSALSSVSRITPKATEDEYTRFFTDPLTVDALTRYLIGTEEADGLEQLFMRELKHSPAAKKLLAEGDTIVLIKEFAGNLKRFIARDNNLSHLFQSSQLEAVLKESRSISALLKDHLYADIPVEEEEDIRESYLQWCGRTYQREVEMDLAGCGLVPPRFQMMKTDAVDQYAARQALEWEDKFLDEILTQENIHIKVYADSGFGKSFALKYIMRDAARLRGLVPLLFTFREAHEWNEGNFASSMASRIQRIGVVLPGRAKAYCERELRNGRFLFLIDALDQIPRDYNSDILRIFKDSELLEGRRCIVTGREYAFGYFGGTFGDYQNVRLDEFPDDEEIMGKFFGKDIYNEIKEHRAYDEIQKVPLLLKMLRQLWQEKGKEKVGDLIGNKTDLYEEYMKNVAEVGGQA